jgi:hypothetical protein
MYTLVGAPLLGFDLARRDGGADVADLLRDALACGKDRLVELGEGYDERPVGWPDRVAGGSPTEGGRLAAALGDTARLVGEGRVEEALRLLATAPVAGLPELLGVVRDEVFDWTWDETSGVRRQPEPLRRGVAVTCDALVAAWHGPALSPAFSAQLAAAYARCSGPAPRLPLGPQDQLLTDVLRRISGCTRLQVEDLGVSAERARRNGAWGEAMHSATWAVHMTGRVREAAAAQLQAVRALATAGVTAAEAAAGTWNLVSGTCQALVVSDLLETPACRRLVEPAAEVLGRIEL